MAGSDQQVVIEIKGDSAALVASLEKANVSLEKLVASTKKADDSVEKLDQTKARASSTAGLLSRAWGSMGESIVKLNQGMDLAGRLASLAGQGFDALFQGINRAGQIADLSQKLGVSAQTLSSMELAAKTAGVSLEGLGTGFKFLAKNSQEAISGSKEMQAAFKQVGLSVSDLKRLNPEQLMAKLADSFAGAEDGAGKTALSLKLLGRSGADLIPFLNAGSAEMLRLAGISQRLGLTLSQDVASAADAVGDNMDILKSVFLGVATQIGVGMLPALDRVTNALVDLASKAGISNGGLKDLGASIAQVGLDQIGPKIEALAQRVKDVGPAQAFKDAGRDLGEALVNGVIDGALALLPVLGARIKAGLASIWQGFDVTRLVEASASDATRAAQAEIERLSQARVGAKTPQQADLLTKQIDAITTSLRKSQDAAADWRRRTDESLASGMTTISGKAEFVGKSIQNMSADTRSAAEVAAGAGKHLKTLGTESGAAADALKKLAAEMAKLSTTGAIWQAAASGATTVAKATIEAAAASKLASTEGITAAQAYAQAQKEAANAVLQQSAATRQSAEDIALSNAAFSDAIAAGQSYEEATRTATAALEDATIARAAEAAGISDQIPLLLANAEAKRANTEATRALQAEAKYNEDIADLEREVSIWTQVRDGVIGVKQAQHELAVEQAKSALLAQGFPGDIDAAAERMVSLKERTEELKGSFLDLGDILRDAFSQTFDAIVAGTRDLSDAFKGIGISIGKQLFEATLKEKFKFDKTFEGNIFNLGQLVTDVLGGSFEGVFSLAGALFGEGTSGGTSGGGSWLNLLLGSGGSSTGSGGSILNLLLGSGGSGGTGASGGLLALLLPALIGGGQAGAAGSSRLGGALGAAGATALLSWLAGGGGASVLGPAASAVGLSAAPLYNGAADLVSLQGATLGGQLTQGATNIYHGESFFSNGVSGGNLLAGAGGAVGGIAGGYLGGRAAGSLGFTPTTTTGQVISGVVNGVGAIGGGIAAAAAGAAAASSAAASGAAAGLASAAGVLAATVVGLVIAVIVAIIAAILGSLANPTTTQGTLERRAAEGVLDGTKTFKDLQSKLGDIRRTAYIATDPGTQRGAERLGESGALDATRGFGATFAAAIGFEGNSLAVQAEQQGNILTEFFGRIEDTSKETGKSIREELLKAFKDLGVDAPKAFENLNKVADAFFETTQNIGPAWYAATRPDQVTLFGEAVRGVGEIFDTELPAGVMSAQVALESMSKDGTSLFGDLSQGQRDFLREVARSPELFDEYLGRLAAQGYRIDTEKFREDLKHISESAAAIGPQIGKAIFSNLDPRAAVASIAESIQGDIIGKVQEQATTKFLENTDIASSFQEAYAVLDKFKDVDIFDPEQVKAWGGDLQAAVADGSARLQEYLPAIREIQEAFRQAFNADTIEAARVRVAEFAAQAASSLSSIVANVWTAGAATGGKGMGEAFVNGVKQYLASQEGNIVGALFADPNGELAKGMAALNEKWHQIVADGKITPEEMFDYAAMREDFLNKAEFFGDALEEAGVRAAQESGRAWRDSVAAYEKEVQGIVGNAVSAGFQVLNNGGSVQSAMEAFQASFRQGVQQAVVGAIVEALVQSAIIEGALAPFFALLKTYATAALQDGVITPLEQQGLNFLTDTILTKGAELLQQLEPTIRQVFENGVGAGTAAGLQRGINTPVTPPSGGTTPTPAWSPGPGGWTPAAANGGTFHTGKAVVGEAGPELAETIPGGGFRITPISWQQASALTGMSLPAYGASTPLPAYGGGGSCGPGGCSGTTKPACCTSCAGGGPCAGKLPGLKDGGVVYPGSTYPTIAPAGFKLDDGYGCPSKYGYEDGGRRTLDGHVMCWDKRKRMHVDFGPDPVWADNSSPQALIDRANDAYGKGGVKTVQTMHDGTKQFRTAGQGGVWAEGSMGLDVGEMRDQDYPWMRAARKWTAEHMLERSGWTVNVQGSQLANVSIPPLGSVGDPLAAAILQKRVGDIASKIGRNANVRNPNAAQNGKFDLSFTPEWAAWSLGDENALAASLGLGAVGKRNREAHKVVALVEWTKRLVSANPSLFGAYYDTTDAGGRYGATANWYGTGTGAAYSGTAGGGSNEIGPAGPDANLIPDRLKTGSGPGDFMADQIGRVWNPATRMFDLFRYNANGQAEVAHQKPGALRKWDGSGCVDRRGKPIVCPEFGDPVWEPFVPSDYPNPPSTGGSPGGSRPGTGGGGGTDPLAGGGGMFDIGGALNSAMSAVFGFRGSYSRKPAETPVTQTPDPGTCPEGQKSENGVCVSACSAPTPYWDSYRKVCAACPPGQEQALGGGCRTPQCPRGSTWDLTQARCVQGGTGEPPPTTTNPSAKCTTQPRGYYTQDWQECASCGPNWGYDPDTNFCYPGRGGGSTNDAPCRAANNGNAVQIWQVTDPDTGRRLDPSKFPAYHRACDRCGWVWSDSTDDGLHPVCSPPRGAATGGTFTTGSAIVGEAGMPERVDPLPGGGFRVTPLSWAEARAQLGSLPGMAEGGVSGPVTIGGGPWSPDLAADFVKQFTDALRDETTGALADALKQGFENSAPVLKLREEIQTQLDAAYEGVVNGTMTPEKAKEIAAGLQGSVQKMREEAQKLAPILNAIAKEQALDVKLNFDSAMNAVANGASPEEISKAIGDAVRSAVLDAMIGALLAEGPLRTAIDAASQIVSDAMSEAMADGIITPEEQKRIIDAGKGAAQIVNSAVAGVRPVIEGISEGLIDKTEDLSNRARQSFGNAISQAFLQAQGPEEFLSNFKKGIFDYVTQGMIDAFMQSAMVKSILDPLMASFDKLFEDYKKGAIDAEEFRTKARLEADKAIGLINDEAFQEGMRVISETIASLRSDLGIIPEEINRSADSLNRAAEAVTNGCAADCQLQYRLARLDIGRQLIDEAGRLGSGFVDYYDPSPVPTQPTTPTPGQPAPTNPNPQFLTLTRAEYRARTGHDPEWTDAPVVDIPNPAYAAWENSHRPVPRLALGGIVNKPTLALIGEAGPEAVVPLGKGGGSQLSDRIEKLEQMVSALVEALTKGGDQTIVVKVGEQEMARVIASTARVAARGGGSLIPSGR